MHARHYLKSFNELKTRIEKRELASFVLPRLRWRSSGVLSGSGTDAVRGSEGFVGTTLKTIISDGNAAKRKYPDLFQTYWSSWWRLWKYNHGENMRLSFNYSVLNTAFCHHAPEQVKFHEFVCNNVIFWCGNSPILNGLFNRCEGLSEKITYFQVWSCTFRWPMPFKFNAEGRIIIQRNCYSVVVSLFKLHCDYLFCDYSFYRCPCQCASNNAISFYHNLPHRP